MQPAAKLDETTLGILHRWCSRKDPRRQGLIRGHCATTAAGSGCACSGACLRPMTAADLDATIREALSCAECGQPAAPIILRFVTSYRVIERRACSCQCAQAICDAPPTQAKSVTVYETIRG